MPIRWPLPQVSRPSIARTPVESGASIRGRVQGCGGMRWKRFGPMSAGCGLPSTALPVASMHAAQQLIAHAQPARGADQAHAVAVAHAGQIGKGIEQRQVVAEADHLGHERRAASGAGSRPAPRPAPGNPATETVMPTVRATLPRSAVGMMASSCWVDVHGFDVRSVLLRSAGQLRSRTAGRSTPNRVSTRQPPGGDRRDRRRIRRPPAGKAPGPGARPAVGESRMVGRVQVDAELRIAGRQLQGLADQRRRRFPGARPTRGGRGGAAMAAATWTALFSQCVQPGLLGVLDVLRRPARGPAGAWPAAWPSCFSTIWSTAACAHAPPLGFGLGRNAAASRRTSSRLLPGVGEDLGRLGADLIEVLARPWRPCRRS